MTAPRPITAELAAYATAASYDALPEDVRIEAMHAFLNWVGCTLGGSREEVTERAAKAAMATGGAAQATVLGQNARTDVVSAAFVNCVASSALAYDDTHLATVTHPTGPVAAPLLAHAETTPVDGRTFLAALAAGMEIQCRMSNVLLLPPAEANLSLYITGQTGPIGGAAALGRVMGFDDRQMRWAIGHAATQAAGFRATHGAMSGLVVPAFGARAAYFAAHLAAAELACKEDILESPSGFVSVFARNADLGRATDGLGQTHEILANTYKPYPCGIVIQPAIDACREVLAQAQGAEIVALRLEVHPLCLKLADRPDPKSVFEAQVSLHHWAAAVMLRGQAGIPEIRPETIFAPDIAAFRQRVTGVSSPALGREQARAEAELADGRVITAFVESARGSIARKMTPAELDEKFLAQARMVLDAGRAEALLRYLHGIAEVPDVGGGLAARIT